MVLPSWYAHHCVILEYCMAFLENIKLKVLMRNLGFINVAHLRCGLKWSGVPSQKWQVLNPHWMFTEHPQWLCVKGGNEKFVWSMGTMLSRNISKWWGEIFHSPETEPLIII